MHGKHQNHGGCKCHAINLKNNFDVIKAFKVGIEGALTTRNLELNNLQ